MNKYTPFLSICPPTQHINTIVNLLISFYLQTPLGTLLSRLTAKTKSGHRERTVSAYVAYIIIYIRDYTKITPCNLFNLMAPHTIRNFSFHTGRRKLKMEAPNQCTDFPLSI